MPFIAVTTIHPRMYEYAKSIDAGVQDMWREET